MRKNNLLSIAKIFLLTFGILILFHLSSSRVSAACRCIYYSVWNIIGCSGDYGCGMCDANNYRCCTSVCDHASCSGFDACMCNPNCANCNDCSHCQDCAHCQNCAQCDNCAQCADCDHCTCCLTGGHCNPTGCSDANKTCAYGVGGGYDCYTTPCTTYPNAAHVWDFCGTTNCGTTGNYCGYSSSCTVPTVPGGYGSCEETNTTYCYTTTDPPAGDCSSDTPGGICGGNCGQKRTKLIWWKDTVPIEPKHCGDVCIPDAGCAAQCGPTPTSPPGATHTPTPPVATSTPTPGGPTPTCTCASWTNININGCSATEYLTPRAQDCLTTSNAVTLNITSSCATQFQLANIDTGTACADVADGSFGSVYTYSPGAYSWTVTSGYGERKVCMRVTNGYGVGKCGGMVEVVTPTPTATPVPPTATPTPHVIISAQSPGGTAVNVYGMSFSYDCAFWPVCFTSISTNVSNVDKYGYGGVNGGGGIALYANQVLLGITPNPAGGSYLVRRNDLVGGASPSYNWDWHNYWWPSYPYTGSRSLVFIVVTPTPPPCTASGLTPVAGCFGPTNQPGFHADYGGGANQIQFAVDNSLVDPGSCANPFDGSWSCNSGWTSSTNYGYPSCTLATNPTGTPYYWSARAHSTTGACTDSCFFPQYSFSIDRAAPTTPVTPACTRSGDNVTCNWGASHDDGCLDCSTNACKYWIRGYIQGATPPSGATPTPIEWNVNNGEWVPGSYAAPSYTATGVCAGHAGLYYVFNVYQAKDDYAIGGNLNSDNESTTNPLWRVLQCPTPTLYPTIHITGILEQQSGNNCYQVDASTPFAGVTIAVAAAAGSCTTPAPVCNVIPGGGSGWAYNCNVTFNNQTCAPTPTGRFTLSAHASDSDPGVWGPTPVGTTCGTTSTTVGYDLNAPATIIRNVIFNSSAGDWIKLKSSSYWTSTARTNLLPAVIINPYDADDRDERVFILGGATPAPAGGDAGVVLGVTACGTDDCYSDPHNWYDEGKSYTITYYNPLSYLEYVRSLKEYRTITSLGSADSGINVIAGNQTISANLPTGRNIVLIVTNASGTALGSVNINLNNFNATNNDSIAIIADTINFCTDTNNPAAGCTTRVREAHGIFIADHINTGTTDGTTDEGLKINGNLIALVSFTNNRARLDTTRPTIFIINDPEMYIDLLSYLSKSIYDWKQLQ